MNTEVCRNCVFAYYDTSSKGNWYCTRHNTHYEADDHCGYFQRK